MKMRIGSLLMLSALWTGCTSIHNQVDTPLPCGAADYAEGQTHFHQVLDELGPPTRISRLPGGFAFLYETLSISERQIGISSSMEWLNLIKLAVADAKLHRTVLLLNFRTNGILAAKSYHESDEKLGMGGSLQPIISIQPIVDASEYEDDASDSIEWGFAMLRPPPQTLNDHQSLSTGMAGLEQGGTTSKVGQRALEMR